MNRFLALLLTALLITGCADSYDDSALKNDLRALQERIAAVEQAVQGINSDLRSYASLVAAMQGARYITAVSELDGAIRITYNDGTSYTLSSGAKGATGDTGTTGTAGEAGKIEMPLLKIDPTDGYWYISYDAGKSWTLLLDPTGKPVQGLGTKGETGDAGSDGAAGKAPTLGVDAQGFWTIDLGDGNGPQRILSENGRPIVADPSKMPVGYFSKAEVSADGQVLQIELITGESLSLPIVGGILFELTAEQVEQFKPSETRSFALKQQGITEIAIERPAGWAVQVSDTAVTITAPSYSSEGEITLYASTSTALLKLATLTVRCAIATGEVDATQCYGYGAQTTGGAGATAANTHHFNSGTAFRDWLKLREKNKSTTPAIVWLSGTFTASDGRDSGSPWFDIKRTSNITIYGTDSFKMQNVGFFLNEAENIILRNIYIVMPKADNGADGISMQESKNVWVDHCTFESVNQEKDYEDGSCDITHATSGVTVSWCHYIKTQKSSLVGHSNSATEDAAITATFHHNFFDGSSSRHPRVRFGKVHVYNNFYNGCTTYGVGSAYGAMVLVEHNAFDNVHLPTDICTFPAKKSGSSWVSNLTGSVAGYLYAADNAYTNIPSNASDPYPFTNVEWKAYNKEKLSTPLVYADFAPTYTYPHNPASEVAAIVRAGAGVGKMEGYASAPFAADNGAGQK
ncbi:MAG: hypothetical protein E7132_04040 [Rikenellaceae bacterium]|nr:hypothetical protein [Rikenellaceae bacterium]